MTLPSRTADDSERSPAGAGEAVSYLGASQGELTAGGVRGGQIRWLTGTGQAPRRTSRIRSWLAQPQR